MGWAWFLLGAFAGSLITTFFLCVFAVGSIQEKRLHDFRKEQGHDYHEV